MKEKQKLRNKIEDLKEDRRVLRDNWKEICTALCLDSDSELYTVLNRINVMYMSLDATSDIATGMRLAKESVNQKIMDDCAAI